MKAICMIDLQEEMGTRLTDENCYQAENETGETSHLCEQRALLEVCNWGCGDLIAWRGRGVEDLQYQWKKEGRIEGGAERGTQYQASSCGSLKRGWF